jgi:hypothetical protein
MMIPIFRENWSHTDSTFFLIIFRPKESVRNFSSSHYCPLYLTSAFSLFIFSSIFSSFIFYSLYFSYSLSPLTYLVPIHLIFLLSISYSLPPSLFLFFYSYSFYFFLLFFLLYLYSPFLPLHLHLLASPLYAVSSLPPPLILFQFFLSISFCSFPIPSYSCSLSSPPVLPFSLLFLLHLLFLLLHQFFLSIFSLPLPSPPSPPLLLSFPSFSFYSISSSSNFSFSAYVPYFEKIKGGLWDHLAACVSVYPPIFFSFSMRSMSCQRNIGDCFFPELLVILLLFFRSSSASSPVHRILTRTHVRSGPRKNNLLVSVAVLGEPSGEDGSRRSFVRSLFLCQGHICT